MRRIIEGDQEKVTMRQKKIRGVWYPGNQMLLLSVAAQQATPKQNGLKKQQSFILLINLQCGQGSVGTCCLCSFSVSQGDSPGPRTHPDGLFACRHRPGARPASPTFISGQSPDLLKISSANKNYLKLLQACALLRGQMTLQRTLGKLPLMLGLFPLQQLLEMRKEHLSSRSL